MAAQVIRIMTDEVAQSQPLTYSAGIIPLVVLYAFLLWRPSLPAWASHLSLGVESVLVVGILALDPELDVVSAFFVPLAFLAPLLLPAPQAGRWILAFLVLTAVPLMWAVGILEGLALAAPTMAGVIALPALMLVNHETERARLASQHLLSDLDARHRELQSYAERAEELAALQERERLSRDLHDRVSQILFGIQLTARSAELVAGDDPSRVVELLDRLEESAADALRQLRNLISEMRP